MVVWEADCGEDWRLLVAAETAGRAKVLAHNYDGWTDFLDWRVRRACQYDDFATGEAVWACDADLPDGAPLFWYDGEEE